MPAGTRGIAGVYHAIGRGVTVDLFEITGGNRLRGTITVNGSKNAALPIMAASILTEGETVLKGVPRLEDVKHLSTILERLGVNVSREENGDIRLKVEDEMNCHAEYEFVRKMRASVCVMGPLLAKRRHAQVSLPGGCNIGDRPIDLHIAGMQQLGAESELVSGYNTEYSGMRFVFFFFATMLLSSVVTNASGLATD